MEQPADDDPKTRFANAATSGSACSRPELPSWGKAMLNEMDAMENDWAAFRWAIGGTASLFRGFELPINDVSEVPQCIETVQNTIRRMHAIGYLACVLVIGGLSYSLVIFPNVGERVGCVLTILGAGLPPELHWNQVRSRAAASRGDSSATIDRYRKVLLHMRDFHCGTWFWSRMFAILPGPLLFAYALHRTHPEAPESFVAGIIGFLGLGMIGIPLKLNLSRKFQREIDRLDNLKEPL